MEMEQISGEDIKKSLKKYIKQTYDCNGTFPQEYWNPLQMACSIGDMVSVKALLEKGADSTLLPKGNVVPKVYPIHLCALCGHNDLLSLLATPSNVDIIDQWGFTPLHYAVYRRNSSIMMILLDIGANPTIRSKAGNTAYDLATELGYQEMADILSSHIHLTTDPNISQFRNWLRSIGAGSYINSFLRAGYDLAFIAEHGLSDEDLASLGIPMEQMGIRRKLKLLHKINEFIEKKESEEDEEESGNEEESVEETEDSEEES